MLQLKNKKKVYLYIFIFILISTITNNKLTENINKIFLIDKININTDSIEAKKSILLTTNYIMKQNIFKLDKKILVDKINKLNFLENIKIQKKFPSSIDIKARQTKFVATTFIDQKKYFVGYNGKFIPAKKFMKNQTLPIIFGKFFINDFINLKKTLNLLEIDDNEIFKYYSHKNNRWDLYFKNNILIKLPEKNYTIALKIYRQFATNNKIKPNTVLDLRISNRLTVKSE